MKRKLLKAAVIDDHDLVRRVLVEGLRFSDFQADGYSEAEEFLSAIAPIHEHPDQNVPDIIIVDLELKDGRMQGLELICQLVGRDIPSEIIAITGHQSTSVIIENAVCFGAATILTKPFDIFDLSRRAEHLARIGRNRRLSRLQEGSQPPGGDPTRKNRPVFLSYATPDLRIANGVRRSIEARGIGVWYAPTTLSIGEEWRDRIEKGIDDACIFLPFVSDHYIKSPYCMGELTRFRRRVEKDKRSKLVFLPTIGDLSAEAREDPTIKWLISDYQHIPLMPPRLTDGLTALLARVQQFVHQAQMKIQLGDAQANSKGK